MKVKEAIEFLKSYDPEREFVITLPPGWYKNENNDVWGTKGWTIDSIDYFLIPDKDNIIAVCPLAAPEAMQ